MGFTGRAISHVNSVVSVSLCSCVTMLATCVAVGQVQGARCDSASSHFCRQHVGYGQGPSTQPPPPSEHPHAGSHQYAQPGRKLLLPLLILHSPCPQSYSSALLSSTAKAHDDACTAWKKKKFSVQTAQNTSTHPVTLPVEHLHIERLFMHRPVSHQAGAAKANQLQQIFFFTLVQICGLHKLPAVQATWQFLQLWTGEGAKG